MIVPIAQGLTVGEASNGATVTPLLKTSSDSFSKAAGYAMTTYDKEDGDTDGPFTLAVLHRGRLGRPDLLGGQ